MGAVITSIKGTFLNELIGTLAGGDNGILKISLINPSNGVIVTKTIITTDWGSPTNGLVSIIGDLLFTISATVGGPVTVASLRLANSISTILGTTDLTDETYTTNGTYTLVSLSVRLLPATGSIV